MLPNVNQNVSTVHTFYYQKEILVDKQDYYA